MNSQPEVRVKPHDGPLVLVLGVGGLLGVVLGFLCFVPAVAGLGMGVAAWIVGRKNLSGMESGEIDPAGRPLVQAGKVCGIIATFTAVAFLALLVFLIPGRIEAA